MKIASYLGVSQKEVEKKTFNILIGVSIGNKLFTKDLFESYLLWANRYTKEKILILIGDKIHAINYEVRNKYTKEKALRKAEREGKKKIQLIKEVMNKIESIAPKVEIITREDIETDEYKQKVKRLEQEFENNSYFKEDILNIVKGYAVDRIYTERELILLSQYIIEELPLIAFGIIWKGITYELQLYPGCSRIDYLGVALGTGTEYAPLAYALKSSQRLRHIEAYC